MSARVVGRAATYAVAVGLLATAALKSTALVHAYAAGAPDVETAIFPPALSVGAALVELVLGTALLRRPDNLTARSGAALLTVLLTMIAFGLAMRGIPLAKCGCFGRLSGALEPAHLSISGLLMICAGTSLLLFAHPLKTTPPQTA